MEIKMCLFSDSENKNYHFHPICQSVAIVNPFNFKGEKKWDHLSKCLLTPFLVLQVQS